MGFFNCGGFLIYATAERAGDFNKFESFENCPKHFTSIETCTVFRNKTESSRPETSLGFKTFGWNFSRFQSF